MEENTCHEIVQSRWHLKNASLTPRNVKNGGLQCNLMHGPSICLPDFYSFHPIFFIICRTVTLLLFNHLHRWNAIIIGYSQLDK